MQIINKDELKIDKQKLIHKKRKKKETDTPKIIYPVVEKKNISPSIIIVLLGLILVGGTESMLILFSNYTTDIVLPVFFPSHIVSLIVAFVLYVLVTISLLLIAKTNLSKKIFVLYVINAVLNLLLILSVGIIKIWWLALLISLIILFFAFTLQNEFKKSNKYSYYVFIPYSIWTIFVVVCNYFVTMLN